MVEWYTLDTTTYPLYIIASEYTVTCDICVDEKKCMGRDGNLYCQYKGVKIIYFVW